MRTEKEIKEMLTYAHKNESSYIRTLIPGIEYCLGFDDDPKKRNKFYSALSRGQLKNIIGDVK